YSITPPLHHSAPHETPASPGGVALCGWPSGGQRHLGAPSSPFGQRSRFGRGGPGLDPHAAPLVVAADSPDRLDQSYTAHRHPFTARFAPPAWPTTGVSRHPGNPARHAGPAPL